MALFKAPTRRPREVSRSRPNGNESKILDNKPPGGGTSGTVISMGLFLAVDAGGTRTTFLLADDHRELARSVTGTIKRMRADAATTAGNLDIALNELTLASGKSMSAVTATCVGAAGYTVPLVVDWMHEAFAARVAGNFVLAGDVEIALDAGFMGRPGVLLLSGTGSNVAGRLATGEIVTAGGWGPALSDQASGYGIGRAGLRAAVVEHDEHGDSPLLDAILDLWQLETFHALVDFANRQPPPDLSRLAPIVVSHAVAGDTVAKRVLEAESTDLAYIARIILRRVVSSIQGLPDTPPRLAFAGSILEHVPLVRDRLITLLQRDFPTLEPLPGVVDPVLGALWRARQLS